MCGPNAAFVDGETDVEGVTDLGDQAQPGFANAVQTLDAILDEKGITDADTRKLIKVSAGVIKQEAAGMVEELEHRKPGSLSRGTRSPLAALSVILYVAAFAAAYNEQGGGVPA